MLSSEDLARRLRQLDRQNYGAYKSLRGEYQFPRFVLSVERIQGDPFASPSRICVRLPRKVAQFPPWCDENPDRTLALTDYLARRIAQQLTLLNQRRGSGGSGLWHFPRLSQAILARTAVQMEAGDLEIHLGVGLPAQGRRILGEEAAAMFLDDLPPFVDRLCFAALDGEAIRRHLDTAEDTAWLRRQLRSRGWVAFIPDGAILPRASGVDDRPLRDRAIPWQSPPSLRERVTLPHGGEITGTAIAEGITLIVGGGYHGKSTLLQALAQGIYNHIPGDGREYLVSDATTLAIRAEEGRSIVDVDLSPFMQDLPQGRSTTDFRTENASGSTSQAAAMIEALEMGSHLLLIDEDTAATNFLIRDHRMQKLIAKTQEPITPLVDQIRTLYETRGVSSILVMGGSSDYFEVADRLIAMVAGQPQDVTAQARAIAAAYPQPRTPEAQRDFEDLQNRTFPPSLKPQGERPKLKILDRQRCRLGEEILDLSALGQLLEEGQLRAIALTLIDLAPPAGTPLAQLWQTLSGDFSPTEARGDLAAFRPQDLALAFNRWRALHRHYLRAKPPSPSSPH